MGVKIIEMAMAGRHLAADEVDLDVEAPGSKPGRGGDDKVAAFPIPLPTHKQKAHRFLGRTDCPDPERLTNISIFVLPGRSVDAKRRLYQEIVGRLEAFGIPRACVLVRLNELPAENIAVRGGQAVCDVELGYSVDV